MDPLEWQQMKTAIRHTSQEKKPFLRKEGMINVRSYKIKIKMKGVDFIIKVSGKTLTTVVLMG